MTAVSGHYRLWSAATSWCDYQLTVEKPYEMAIRSLFPAKLSEDGQEIRPDVELIPEPDGPGGRWSIAVRSAGRTIGYIGEDKAPLWAGAVRRVMASGFVPTTSSRIWLREYDGWDGLELFTNAAIGLGDPSEALPLNDPPSVPYTMLPRASLVQVTKEEQHLEELLPFVPPAGHGVLFVTLHEKSPLEGRAKPVVEVRIDDRCVGQLTPQMSQRYLPMIRHFQHRGLLTACWGDITGSPVAAEVRISAIKANEATEELLNDAPMTIPPLVTAQTDPSAYDLTPLREYVKPRPPVRDAAPRTLAEPPEWSLIRFAKGRGRYHYAAFRRGNHWETTATGDWGSINRAMNWPDLGPRVREFDYATAVEPVDPYSDPRVRQHLAVVRFRIGNFFFAAINVNETGSPDGDWYMTVPEELTAADFATGGLTWSEITERGAEIVVVTAWTHFS